LQTDKQKYNSEKLHNWGLANVGIDGIDDRRCSDQSTGLPVSGPLIKDRDRIMISLEVEGEADLADLVEMLFEPTTTSEPT
jgi:hypothetical protein